MTSIAKLKDRARKHEQEENWKAAIEAYRKILDASKGDDDLELGTLNRIGDLYLRLGQTDNAVGYYEKAADKYAAAGFFNNAIALCNKVLRHRPDRPETYLKLSRLCAEQGFSIDARRWILEYAERQVRAGRVDTALQGLTDFVDTAGDPDVREFLAQQLASHGRAPEAAEHYARVYARRLERGETAAAERAAKRARAIDPDIDLDAAVAASAAEYRGGDLPTLDEPGEPDTGGAEERGLPGLETRPEAAGGGIDIGEVEGLESAGAPDADDDLGAAELPGLEPTSAGREDRGGGESDTGGIGGLETFDVLDTQEEEAGAGVPPIPDAGLERDTPEEEPEPLPLMDSGFEDAGGEQPEPLPLVEAAPDDTGEEPEPLPLLDIEEEESGPAEIEEPAAPEATGEPERPGEIEEPEAGKPPAEPGRSRGSAGPMPMFDLTSLDFGTGVGGAPAAGTEGEGADEEAGAGTSGLDLDLGEFAGGTTELGPILGEPLRDPEPVRLDVGAVLARSRELVGRGLMREALTELRLLTGGENVGPATFRDALVVLNEIARRQPDDLTALQQRVDFAARAEDNTLMVRAYLGLAEALVRSGAGTKAEAMYERVLALDPQNETAREALGSAAEEEDETVDLDAILLEVGPPAQDVGLEPGGPPEAGSDPEFAAMLSQFKARVSDAELEDAGDHYDLGIAFKEMGLIDEAIAEFQTALTGGEERLKVYEELGQCFVMKGQYTVALKILNRALQVPHREETELLGVYYHLGQCHEHLGQRDEARQAYGKVLAIDPSFQDVPDRMARL